MTTTPLATQMWSRDAFDISSDRGLRKTAKIITAYQITVPPTYTEIQVSQVSGVPQLNSSFPGLPDMFMVNKSYQRASPILWIATLEYEGTNIDPIGEPPEISWSDTSTEEAIDQDWNGRAIVTANGEPIDGVTMQIADNVLSVKRNYRAFNPHITHQYRHSVNSDTFASYPPGTGRLTGYNAKQIYNANTGGHWEVTARIEFRYPYNTQPARAWYARVRHEGYYERRGNLVVRATDNFTEDTSRPVLLKPDGTREPNPNNAHWLEIRRYGSLPYQALGLLD